MTGYYVNITQADCVYFHGEMGKIKKERDALEKERDRFKADCVYFHGEMGKIKKERDTFKSKYALLMDWSIPKPKLLPASCDSICQTDLSPKMSESFSQTDLFSTFCDSFFAN